MCTLDRSTRNTNTVCRLMKNRLYDGNTLDEVWPTERKLERSWVVAEPAAEANGGIR